MDSILDQLVEIAGYDERRIAIIEQGRYLKRKLATHEKVVTDLDEQLAQLTEAEAERLRADQQVGREVEQFERRRLQAQRALDTGMGSVEAAERQVETCSARVDELETQQLELMELSESHEAQREGLQRNRDAAEEVHATLLAATNPVLDKLRADLAKVKKDHKPLLQALPIEEHAAYLQLVKLKKTALAEVKEGACSSCGHFVPLGLLFDVKARRRVVCAGCARWLYILRPSDG
jgi:predicted  nucleic acid-binding Zn-ribbon protein